CPSSPPTASPPPATSPSRPTATTCSTGRSS
ncbi:MAG: hypothetical protein AVDCRST_MAG40-3014, partial [uncultured Gemmatimonadaceae bacterium]